ncbi:MAG: ABC transporter permease [Pseudobutyrivibrio sp.]|nr:ABC transporter permease [Pseudobutyrivibrio sp.]
MLFSENILVALAGLRANIMRSLLTMLGIIIGIASVIAIMTVGNSITVMVNETMQGLGANNIQMGINYKPQEEDVSESGMDFGDGYMRAVTDEDLISQDMLDAFQEKYKDKIQYILLEERVANSTVTIGKNSANIQIVGYNKDNIDFMDIDMVDGRKFLARDYADAKNVCMVSDKFVERLYDGDTSKALGTMVDVPINGDYHSYYIVGVYEYVPDQFSFGDANNPTTTFYLPLSTAREETHNQGKGYEWLTLVTTIDTDNDSFSEEVRDYFNMTFYAKNDAFEIQVINMESMMDSMNTMINTIQLALSVIAGISLVVGGIGVMNIMLVSITERTKEIGTRKALGATNGSIRLQFITESVVICVIGGIIGIILGIALGSLAMKVMGYQAAISVSSIVIAVGFSMAIGIFFGYYPANKAAQLNPIDALRYE